MNGPFTVDFAIIILVIAVLAIPIAFSYTAIRKRRAIGRVILRWRPGSVQTLLIAWCLGGMMLSIFLYQFSASKYAKLIFLGAFFSGIMNALGSTIAVGELGIFVRRRAIPWKGISEYSILEKAGKHYIRVLWSKDTPVQEYNTDVFVVPARMVKVTLALFQNFIPSIQLPRSN
jgi:hypothetical protein